MLFRSVTNRLARHGRGGDSGCARLLWTKASLVSWVPECAGASPNEGEMPCRTVLLGGPEVYARVKYEHCADQDEVDHRVVKESRCVLASLPPREAHGEEDEVSAECSGPDQVRQS